MFSHSNSPKGIWRAAACALAALLAPPARAQISCAPEPGPPPKNISGGEGFPPLPLPVTPLRRTERKRAPAPPTLMSKVNYGQEKVQQGAQQVWQWTTAPGDMQHLFDAARSTLDVNYKGDVVRLDQFDYQPDNVPIMFFSGREKFQLDEDGRARLRAYVLRGGAILGAAGNGTDAFSDSFAAEMRAMFPDRPWHALAPDDPVFHAHFALDKIQYRRGADQVSTEAPKLEGLNVGCRTAILLCRADLSCGWDQHTHPDGYRVMPEDATRLGINILAYQLAAYRLGRVESVPVVFRAEDARASAVEVGQVMHSGDWDPCPTALQYLLRKVADDTSAGVDYKRVGVDLEKADLSRFPFIYITGHLDFTLSPRAAENLGAYLRNGGFLMASDCCDRLAFDIALRREIAKALPEAKLEALPAGHAVYGSHYALTAASGDVKGLEGVTLGGRTCVVYSPASIGTAWEGEPRPFCALPDAEFARKLGVNTLVYAMTH